MSALYEPYVHDVDARSASRNEALPAVSERLGSASFLDAERASTSWTYGSYSADNDGH